MPAPTTARSQDFPARSVTVAHQRVAQRVFQRPEPGRVFLPLLEPVAENWPADLFRARRTHAALGLVECEAVRLKGKTAMVENAPHAAFEIFHHVIVLHPQD